MKCGGVCVCLEVQNLSYISHNDQDWKGITLLYMQLWKAVTQSRHILEKQLQRAKKSQVWWLVCKLKHSTSAAPLIVR